MNYSKHSNDKKLKKLRSSGNKITTLISTVFFRFLILGIICVAVIGVSSVVGITNSIIDSVPEVNFDNMIPEGYTSFIRNQDGEVIQELSVGDSNRIYVEIDQIPKHVRDAFIAIEDERFYEHNGIDMQGIFRAFWINFQNKSITQGASTITQQVIKNNVLTSDVTFTRKIQEQYLAMKAEEILSKDEILELYLNTAGLGKGTLGVQAASKRYFNKDVGDLTIAESAVLACITKFPSNLDPINHPENNKKRQRIVLKYMYEQGKITKAQYDEALKEDVYANIKIIDEENKESSNYSYFVDETIRRVISDLEVQGYSTNQATNLVYRGGLNIYITQDANMQQIVDEVYSDEKNFPSFRDDYKAYLQYTLSAKINGEVKHFYKEKVLRSNKKAEAYMEKLKSEWLKDGGEIIAEKHYIIPQPQSAFVLMDYHTGHVKAIASGRGEKIGNNVFDRATQAKRQPGSTFKVLAAYMPALDQRGYTLAKVHDDAPYTIYGYSPKNWYNHQAYNFWGLNTIRAGIKWSMNILAVKTIVDIGIETGFEALKSLGFTTLVEKDKVLSLPLGGLTDGVTLLELTNAYGAIANDGNYMPPLFYTKVLNHDGSILLNNEPKPKRVMKETTSFLLTSAMQDVVTSGTGKSARFPNMHIAGKTGTTSSNKDKLFVGYTPYYIGGVWIGHDIPERMNHNRSYQRGIWKKIMRRVHEGLPDKAFEMPNGITTANICTVSGKRAVSGLCNHDPRGSTVKTEYFAVGTVPSKKCDVHVRAKVCAASGLYPTKYCPNVVTRIFTSRKKPIPSSAWKNGARIRDYKYELPSSSRTCHIHGSAPPIETAPPKPNTDAPTPSTTAPAEIVITDAPKPEGTPSTTNTTVKPKPSTNNSSSNSSSNSTTPKATTKPKTTKEQTTKPPTTKAQTTKPPTTKAPTTKPPTTKAPTTKPPTTKAPATQAETASQ